MSGPGTSRRGSIRTPSGPRSGQPGLRARHSPVAELPGRPGRARRHPGRGGPAARPPGPRDRPGPRPADGGPARRRARRSPRSSSTAAWPPSCASGSTGVESLRLIEGDALDQDLVHLVEPPYDVVANLPYHITSPILHALLGSAAAPGAARPDGPARGRRADRGAAREDELPVGLRPVPRPRPDRVRRPGRRPSSRNRPSSRRSSSSSRTTPTIASTRRPRTSCGAWSRPPSASGAR